MKKATLLLIVLAILLIAPPAAADQPHAIPSETIPEPLPGCHAAVADYYSELDWCTPVGVICQIAIFNGQDFDSYITNVDRVDLSISGIGESTVLVSMPEPRYTVIYSGPPVDRFFLPLIVVNSYLRHYSRQDGGNNIVP